MRHAIEPILASLLYLAACACLAVCGGCSRTSSSTPSPEPALSALDIAWAGASATAAVTSVATSDAPPAPKPPEPTPEPISDCGRCNGTGRIKPDGRIEIDCPDCGGDGVLSFNDLMRAFEAKSKVHERFARQLAEQRKEVTTLKQQFEVHTPENTHTAPCLLPAAQLAAPTLSTESHRRLTYVAHAGG
jgi:hypothetical protein